MLDLTKNEWHQKWRHLFQLNWLMTDDGRVKSFVWTNRKISHYRALVIHRVKHFRNVGIYLLKKILENTITRFICSTNFSKSSVMAYSKIVVTFYLTLRNKFQLFSAKTQDSNCSGFWREMAGIHFLISDRR